MHTLWAIVQLQLLCKGRLGVLEQGQGVNIVKYVNNRGPGPISPSMARFVSFSLSKCDVGIRVTMK
jgi:hypothetical protein